MEKSFAVGHTQRWPSPSFPKAPTQTECRHGSLARGQNRSFPVKVENFDFASQIKPVMNRSNDIFDADNVSLKENIFKSYLIRGHFLQELGYVRQTGCLVLENPAITVKDSLQIENKGKRSITLSLQQAVFKLNTKQKQCETKCLECISQAQTVFKTARVLKTNNKKTQC